jgi:hypothetical protein
MTDRAERLERLMRIAKMRKDVSLAILTRADRELSAAKARGAHIDSLVQRAFFETSAGDAAPMAAVDGYVQLMRSLRAKLEEDILKARNDYCAANEGAALSFGAVQALEDIGKLRARRSQAAQDFEDNVFPPASPT